MAGSKVTYFSTVQTKGLRILVPVTPSTGTAGSDMDAVVKCLIEGPPAGSGLISIPDNVKVKGMGTNGIAYLNFEKGILV